MYPEAESVPNSTRDGISQSVSANAMRKPVLASMEPFTRLIPVERLDEEGVELLAAVAECDEETEFREVATTILEHLCGLGLFRRLSRDAVGDTLRLSYRNLLTLDTVTVTLDAAHTRATRAGAGTTPAPEQEQEMTAVVSAPDGQPRPRPWTLPGQFLHEIASANRPDDLSRALERLYELLRKTIGCERASICLSEGLAESGSGSLLEFEELCSPRDADHVAPVPVRERVESTGETVCVPEPGGRPGSGRFAGHVAGGSLVVAPLRTEGYVYGTLAVWSPVAHAFDPNAVGFVEFVAEFAAGMIKGRLELDELIFVDPTSQIHNRRYFDEQLSREIERSQRTGKTVALLIADIDDFKRVNDTLGHPAGDSILRQVGRILRENARQVDIVARYGGEEFGLILPDISVESALVVAERIRNTVSMHSFITGSPDRPTWDLTISIGAALYPTDADTREELVDRADRIALFEAKRRGKNRVVLYSDLHRT